MTAPPDPNMDRGSAPAGRPSTNALPSAERSTTLRAVAPGDDVHPFAGLTVSLAGGRVIAIEDAAYWTIWAELDGKTFKSAVHLAKWVGRFYGYHSTTPTSHWITEDGVAWWVTNALDTIRLNTLRHQFDPLCFKCHRHGAARTFDAFVPSGKGIHLPFGTLLAHAFASAGVIVLSIEEASTE